MAKIDKSKWNRKIKVSQATIDKIKKQGMTASLKSVSGSNSPEYREALRRMYGDARVGKATAVTKKPSNPKQADYYAASTKKLTTFGGQPSGYQNPSQVRSANKPSNPRQADYYTASSKPTSAKPKPTPKPKPKANGSGMNPVYDLIARAWYNTPKNQRDRRNAAKAAAAKKNK